MKSINLRIIVSFSFAALLAVPFSVRAARWDGGRLLVEEGPDKKLTVVPYPQKVVEREGVFLLPTNRLERKDIVWNTDASIRPEGYRLVVTPTGVTAWSSDAAGAFYAFKTLEQLARVEGGAAAEGSRSTGVIVIPCCEIDDAPRYPHRGYMLDDARHFLGKETVKHYLDLMSRVKMNVFHWHLTDDEGWRLQLKCHPEVCARGSVKPTSMEHGSTEEKPVYDGIPYGPFFYTHEDVKEVLAYAAERHITVIPEFDFPAHSRALFVSHPEFTCLGPNKTFEHPWCVMGPQYECFCAANEEGMKFIEDILAEICDLFPSKYIHIGGDECPPNRWRDCPKCRRLMADLGLPPERASALQTRITIRFAEFLAKRGRTAVAWRNALQWDAGVPENLPKNLVLQLAHDVVDARTRTARGIDIVQSPKEATYFDMPQDVPSDPFQYYAGAAYAATLRSAFENDPEFAMTPDQAAHVRGVECCAWGEFIWGWFDLNWKMWPRSFAVAEVGWTGHGKTSFEDFLSRVRPLRERLVAEHIHAAPVVDRPVGRLVAAEGVGLVATDALAGTKAAILSEGYGPTKVPADEMRAYVRDGGTLFVSADQVMGGMVPADLAGVTFDGSSTNCDEVVMNENGQRALRLFQSQGVHRLLLGVPTTARVFMKDSCRRPAVWANDVGKGRVYTVGCRGMRAESYGKNYYIDEQRKEIEKGICPYPFVRYLLSRVRKDLNEDVIVLSNRYGRVSVSLVGAQVLSYVPAGGEEILFCPKDMDFGTGERAMHGGIPVCWPWFSRYGESGSRMHGLVRYCRWTLSERAEDGSSVVLTLASSDETRRLWPHDFRLRYVIRLAKRLELSLEAENTGTDAFDVTTGFHPYFKVNDPSRVTVLGLPEPLRAYPGIDGGRPTVSGGRYAIVEDGADTTVEVGAEGERKLVVWCMESDQADRKALVNLARDDWRRFVCVEPTVIGRENAVHVQPGGRHRLSMTIGRRPAALDALMPRVRDIRTDGACRFASADAPVSVARAAIAGAPADVADQAYRLEIAEDGIRITAGGAAGERFARATLAQLRKLSGVCGRGGRTTGESPYCGCPQPQRGDGIPCATITDWPAIRWRGQLIDVGRNFMPLPLIREVLDFMAAYKYNLFHWHLTDYWGWRLESKAVPELSSDAATLHDVGKRYTQQEFLELLDYAAARGITVMPEFDMPGHTKAFRAALGVKAMRDPKAGRALTAFLDEFVNLVPPEKVPFIHLGTDEVWSDDEKVDEAVVREWAKHAAARGHTLVGWTPGIALAEAGAHYVEMQWGQDLESKGFPCFDMTHRYIDIVDPFTLLNMGAYVKPCPWDIDPARKLGAVIGAWHDDVLGGNSERLFTDLQFFPSLVINSDPMWAGRAKPHVEYRIRLPQPTNESFGVACDLERRMAAQRDRVLGPDFRWPFSFLRQTQMRWRLSYDDGTLIAADVPQATILPRYGRNPDPRFSFCPPTNRTVVAETWIRSPVEQTVGAWIGFTYFDRSRGRFYDAPTARRGEWNRHGAFAELNGERIAPPAWTHPSQGADYAPTESRPVVEVPLTDEEYFMRALTSVRLRKGWNHVRLVMPAPPKPGPDQLFNWVGTFALLNGSTDRPQEVPGLVYSAHNDTVPGF